MANATWSQMYRFQSILQVTLLLIGCTGLPALLSAKPLTNPHKISILTFMAFYAMLWLLVG
jgi:hypothetical protein